MSATDFSTVHDRWWVVPLWVVECSSSDNEFKVYQRRKRSAWGSKRRWEAACVILPKALLCKLPTCLFSCIIYTYISRARTWGSHCEYSGFCLSRAAQVVLEAICLTFVPLNRLGLRHVVSKEAEQESSFYTQSSGLKSMRFARNWNEFIVVARHWFSVEG